MIWFGLAPAEPILNAYCLDSLSVYSRNDLVTSPMGKDFDRKQARFAQDEKPYRIEYVKSHPQNNGIKEHGFNEITYQKSLLKFIGHIGDKYGFIQHNR